MQYPKNWSKNDCSFKFELDVIDRGRLYQRWSPGCLPHCGKISSRNIEEREPYDMERIHVNLYKEIIYRLRASVSQSSSGRLNCRARRTNGTDSGSLLMPWRAPC